MSGSKVTPKNEGGNENPTTEEPAGAPETPAKEPEVSEEQPLPETPHGNPPADGEPVENKGNAQVTNHASPGVLINGVVVTDYTAIQAHVRSLENAQQEAQDTFRRDFVSRLSENNRIPATQVDALTEFALGLSPEQFTQWSASYESAPGIDLFSMHGPDASAQGGTESSAQQSRIEQLQGIVAMHQRTMSPEKVKQMKSYIELQKLLGTEDA